MKKTIEFIDRLNDVIGRGIAWLTLAMVVVTFLVVILRYAFSIGWIAMQESVVYLHSLVFMLGAAYTLKQNGHVRVDIFYEKLQPKGRAWVDLFGAIFLLIPFCVFIVYASWDYVALSWSLVEGSREAGGIPGVFLLKTLIPVMSVLIMLQGVSQALRSILILRGDTPPQAVTENLPKDV